MGNEIVMKDLIKIGLFILVIPFFGSVILNFLNNSVEHMFLDDEDDFGCNIELPKGTEYSLPKYKYPWNDSLLKFDNLVIYNQSPGVYDYRFCHLFESSGEIYIKAYEVTDNIRLSSERLKNRSTVNVDKGQQLSCYGPNKAIIIYEGNGVC